MAQRQQQGQALGQCLSLQLVLWGFLRCLLLLSLVLRWGQRTWQAAGGCTAALCCTGAQ